jgi:hypothetical protein
MCLEAPDMAQTHPISATVRDSAGHVFQEWTNIMGCADDIQLYAKGRDICDY